MTQTKPLLSVIVPAYNEASRLDRTLDLMTSYLADGPPFEILVVDDGSADATAQIAGAWSDRGVTVVGFATNRGKGAAVRTGVLASRGRQVLISDADLSTPIEALDDLRPHLERAPLVFGSRAVAGAAVSRRQPLYRELMGKIFNRIIRLLAVRGVADTQCGFKLLDGEVARELFECLITPGFAFDVELAWLARRFGYRIAEVGVPWRNSPESRVDPLRDPPRMLLEIARFRWQHRGVEKRSAD